ncbi:synaptotagmin-2 isoform X5 [Brachypodium distachyon]|nr:synaptotagmin-2 isoform X5 [Brachypodium distachyon]|eukprot:XP_024317078.1 synaptotagmin-2 isoform X5 [Brachypodium distachyon]
MAIPGLYAFVQEIIKTQVANMYLWPKVLEVPIMDAANAQKKPVGILHVNVVRAVKLTKKDLMGKSDPYVKIKLTENKLPSKKTSVKRSNLNPEWNEEFKLVVKDPESQALELTVFDWEQVGKHDKIGMNVIPLKDIVPDETKSVTLNLLKTMDSNDPVNEKFRGQLTVDVTYNPFKEGDTDLDTSDESSTIEKAPDGTPDGGGLLVVIVHEAQDVEGKHHTNPYARIVFRGEERKTKHIKKNRDPRWEQEFEFVCEEPPTNDKMQIEVISRPPSIGIHSKENLGYVVISLGDVISNKRINEKFHLIDSKNGCIQLELQWRTS